MDEHEITAVTPLTEEEKQFCQSALSDLITTCKGLLTCVASSVDGFVVAEASLQDSKGERLAAMSSSAIAVAEAVVHELAYEKIEAVIIEASKGKVIVLSVPTKKQDLILLCACNSEALIGQVLYSTKSTAHKIVDHFNQA